MGNIIPSISKQGEAKLKVELGFIQLHWIQLSAVAAAAALVGMLVGLSIR
jgi:hypothetical protein